MHALTFPIAYLLWHYTTGFKNVARVWMNYLWFVYHLFSVPLLVRTLFSPWKRMDMGYKKGLNVEDWAGTFVVNTLMRIVGAVARSVIIVIGLIGLVIVGVGGLFVFLMWAIIPLVGLLLPVLGILTMFS